MTSYPSSTFGKLADSLMVIAPSPSDVLKEALAGGLTAGLGGLISAVIKSLFGIRDRVDRLNTVAVQSASQIDILVFEPVHTAYREYERLLPFTGELNALPPDWVIARGHSVLDMLSRALTIQELSKQPEDRRIATLLFCGVCARRLIGSKQLAQSYLCPVLDVIRADISALSDARFDIESLSTEVRALESAAEHYRPAHTQTITNHYPNVGTRGEFLGMPRQSQVHHKEFVSGELIRSRKRLAEAIASQRQVECQYNWLISIEADMVECVK